MLEVISGYVQQWTTKPSTVILNSQPWWKNLLTLLVMWQPFWLPNIYLENSRNRGHKNKNKGNIENVLETGNTWSVDK